MSSVIGRGFIAILLSSTIFACARPKYDSQLAPQFAKRKTHEFEVPICDKKILEANLCIVLNWAVPPKDGFSESIAELNFYKLSDLKPIDLPQSHWNLEVYVTMPSMAHKNYYFPGRKIDSFQVRISGLYFKMAGFWKIHFLIQNELGERIASFEESVLAGADICTSERAKP